MELLKLCDYEIQIEEKPKKQLFTISAYDLSYSSVQNSKGISRGGIDLRGHTWRTIKVIATDPKVIPLRTKVRIEFLDKKHKKYNGIYISGDCGSAIKGKRIDLFIEDSGEKRSKEAIEFGITQAIIEIL